MLEEEEDEIESLSLELPLEILIDSRLAWTGEDSNSRDRVLIVLKWVEEADTVSRLFAAERTI